MVFFGYFLDCLLARFFTGTYFHPCLAFVFSFFNYTREKQFDIFLGKLGLQCFLAFLFFRQNFLFDFSYFLLFYLIFSTFFLRIVSKWHLLISVFVFLVGYYLYGGIFYFFLQKPLPFIKWFQLTLSVLPFNLILAFLFSPFWSRRQKGRV